MLRLRSILRASASRGGTSGTCGWCERAASAALPPQQRKMRAEGKGGFSRSAAAAGSIRSEVLSCFNELEAASRVCAWCKLLQGQESGTA